MISLINLAGMMRQLLVISNISHEFCTYITILMPKIIYLQEEFRKENHVQEIINFNIYI